MTRTRRPSLSRRAAAARRADTLSTVASIRRLVRALRLAAQRTQTAAGLGVAQLFVLQQLEPDRPLSLNDLAERTLTDRSSVAAVVDRLHAHGLVDRTVDRADRRRAAIRITMKGRRLLTRAPDAPTTGLIAALRTLTPRELATLAKSLQRLTEAWGLAAEPASMLFADEGPSEERAGGRRRRAGASGRRTHATR